MSLRSGSPARGPALFAGLALWFACTEAWCQPEPGDVFREYTWFNEKGDAGRALRVGGRLGFKGDVDLPHPLDLEHAVRAEAVVEKILCHDGTRDLALRVNGNDWIGIPEAGGIPAPPWEYQHHTYPVVPVPLEHLEAGPGNRFRMRVSGEHPWNWPQNLVNGVHFRIYYDPLKKSHPRGRIVGIASGERIGKAVELACEADSPNGPVRRVDYIAHCEDVNWEGDGVYRRWHYHHLHGKLIHHVGSAEEAPYPVTWDTSWVPDQPAPVKIAARIVDDTGMIAMTPAVEDLEFKDRGFRVELCRPYDVPKKWVTRRGVMGEKFRVRGDLSRATAAQLVWSSWSPGYMNGIFVNGTKVFDSEGPRYAYGAHRITLDDLDAFLPGENTLSTGKTPKHKGRMVHGMEVNWPGIMVLVRYAEDPPDEGVTATPVPDHEGQESFEVVTPSATYYYHKEGAGFASLEDRDGNDWIGYRPKGGAAGHFRGIPNMGLNTFGHPGYTGARSELRRNGPDRAVIASTKEKWNVTWQIHPDFAHMTVHGAGENFWYLYEGTPGGALTDGDAWMRSDGKSGRRGDKFAEDIKGDGGVEWIAFSDEKLDRTLYLARWPDDDVVDHYRPMGPMTVFGFGRAGKGVRRRLSETPNHLIVGLVESRKREVVAAAIRKAHERAAGRGGKK